MILKKLTLSQLFFCVNGELIAMLRLILIISLFYAAPVFATKARLLSLANSFQLTDPQSVYQKPIDLIYIDNLVSLESGVTNATSTTNGAEAFTSYLMSDKAQIALGFGHQDDAIATTRSFMNAVLGAAKYELSQNPVHVFYGVRDSLTSYVLGAFYSNKKDRLNALTESSAGFSAGMEWGNWQFNTVYSLVNTVEAAGGQRFDGKGYWNSSVSYLLDDTLFRFSYLNTDAKSTTGAVENEFHRIETVTLGLTDKKIREENNFFWGAEVVSTAVKCRISGSADCNKIYTSTTLPLWIGFEAQASDWLTLRSALKQIIFVGLIKDEVGYPTGALSSSNGAIQNIAAPANSTAVTLGAGLKFNRITLDALMSTATSQNIDFTNLFSQVGATFNY